MSEIPTQKLETRSNPDVPKNRDFLRFLKPAMMLMSGSLILILLNLLLGEVVFWISLVINLTPISATSLLILLSQVTGGLLIRFLFIPYFKIEENNQDKASNKKLSKTLVVFLISFCLYTLLSMLMVYIFTLLNLIPQTGYGSIIITEEYFEDPLTVILYLAMPSIGAPFFEELLYRRALIPSLEKRGMSPYAAVMASSLIFAIGHLPNDLINGNITGGIVHVSGVFILGLAMSVIYVLTRKVIYPMIIHGLANFVSFLGPLLILANDILILSAFALIKIGMIVVGGIFGAYVLITALKHAPPDWVLLFREKSKQRIRNGFIGFAIITLSILFSFAVVEVILATILISILGYTATVIIVVATFASLLILFLIIAKRSSEPLKKVTEQKI